MLGVLGMLGMMEAVDAQEDVSVAQEYELHNGGFLGDGAYSNVHCGTYKKTGQ